MIMINEFDNSATIKTFNNSISINARKCGDIPRNCLLARKSYDVWSLGVLMYQLFTGSALFHCDFEDNVVDEDQLYDILTFTDDFKSKKLQLVTNEIARNLLSQMLMKNENQRQTIDRCLAHPFISGKTSSRMIGEEPGKNVCYYSIWYNYFSIT